MARDLAEYAKRSRLFPFNAAHVTHLKCRPFACDPDNQEALFDITGVGEANVLDYKRVETTSIEVDGETVDLFRYEGVDPMTKEAFVSFYRGVYQRRPFECQGAKKNCIPEIRPLRDNKGPDGP